MNNASPLEPPSAEYIANVTRSQRSLYAFIMTLVRQPADADDVLQETNIILWQKAAEYDPERDFMPWALRIAQFQAMAHLKRQQRIPKTFDDELVKLIAEEAIADAAELDPRRRALAGCLQKLSEPQRELIAGRYEPKGSVNEMARRRGSTPKAVSESLRRIRRVLLTCIERTIAREAHV